MGLLKLNLRGDRWGWKMGTRSGGGGIDENVVGTTRETIEKARDSVLMKKSGAGPKLYAQAMATFFLFFFCVSRRV